LDRCLISPFCDLFLDHTAVPLFLGFPSLQRPGLFPPLPDIIGPSSGGRPSGSTRWVFPGPLASGSLLFSQLMVFLKSWLVSPDSPRFFFKAEACDRPAFPAVCLLSQNALNLLALYSLCCFFSTFKPPFDRRSKQPFFFPLAPFPFFTFHCRLVFVSASPSPPSFNVLGPFVIFALPPIKRQHPGDFHLPVGFFHIEMEISPSETPLFLFPSRV